MLVANYNMVLIFIAVCFYLSFPKRGEVTERDTGLNNVLFSFLGTVLALLIAQVVVSGQVIESFAFQSNITGQLQHYFLYLVASMLMLTFAVNVLYYVKQRSNYE